jgi:hypothetical protein
MALQKSARFLFSLLNFGGEVEGDKSMFREKAQKCGGFAGLSGTGQGDHWPCFRGAPLEVKEGPDRHWIVVCANAKANTLRNNPHGYVVRHHFRRHPA